MMFHEGILTLDTIFAVFALVLVGLGSGLYVSSGVFTVFTAVGLVPRFADKTKTAGKILLYENMIILGTFFGMLFSEYESFFKGFLPRLIAGLPFKGTTFFLLTLYGFLTGAYIGCLAISIAELFDAIPIMTKRTKLKRGLGFLMLSYAAGKLIGGFAFCRFFV